MRIRYVLLFLPCLVTATFIGARDSVAQGNQAKATLAATFPLELDHIFIWVSKGAPEAKTLRNAGLNVEARTYAHKGQGTSSVAALFENAYLELIWIDDEEIAARKGKEMGNDVLVRARWQESGASPFGIGLHRRASVAQKLPIPTRPYRADWMQPNTFIDFPERSSDLTEPMCFVVPPYMAVPDLHQHGLLLKSRPELRKRYTHELGLHKLTGVRITVAGEHRMSEIGSLLVENGLVQMDRGKTAYAELTFDGGSRGKSLDARPTLPLVVKY